jgi:fumarylacetoacetate (FAA) hydrolase
MLRHGAARTPYLSFGDHVRITAHDAGGAAPFGALDQRVAAAARRAA